VLSYTPSKLRVTVSQVITAVVVQQWSIWGFHATYLGAHLRQIVTLKMEALQSSETWAETPKTMAIWI